MKRANIPTGDVSLHTLRHTALSRMIASGIDDFTVMAISGHRSVRMLERYTHPTKLRLAYGNDLMRSELFRGIHAEDRCAETADSWHRALLEKGFSEVPL